MRKSHRSHGSDPHRPSHPTSDARGAPGPPTPRLSAVTAGGISVALCTYNGARFLRTQLESIAAQSVQPLEIVLADDGSTDGTVDVARAWARTSDIELRILPGARRLGVTANFERALRAAHHEFIVLSDQDDVWHPDRVRSSVARLEADPAALLVHTDARLVGPDGEPLGAGLLEALRATPAERALISSTGAFRAHLRRNLATGATTTIRAALLEAALPFPASWVHDEWLTIVAAALRGARFLDTDTIDYRQHGSNEIGVTLLGTRQLIRRMLAPRGDRYTRLADRAAALENRLATLAVPEEYRRLSRSKAAFERARAAYPRARVTRLPAVLGELVRGRYSRLSSQGRLDAVRDLVQPA